MAPLHHGSSIIIANKLIKVLTQQKIANSTSIHKHMINFIEETTLLKQQLVLQI